MLQQQGQGRQAAAPFSILHSRLSLSHRGRHVGARLLVLVAAACQVDDAVRLIAVLLLLLCSSKQADKGAEWAQEGSGSAAAARRIMAVALPPAQPLQQRAAPPAFLPLSPEDAARFLAAALGLAADLGLAAAAAAALPLPPADLGGGAGSFVPAMNASRVACLARAASGWPSSSLLPARSLRRCSGRAGRGGRGQQQQSSEEWQLMHAHSTAPLTWRVSPDAAPPGCCAAPAAAGCPCAAVCGARAPPRPSLQESRRGQSETKLRLR